ncbi:hypothetical protein KDL45_09460, partial [bacterium]|nr:hypothetical protein [bacterium]
MLPPLILWGSHWVYYDPNKKDEYRRHPPSWCSLLLKKRHFYEMEPDNPQLLKDLRACIKGERPPLNMALGNGILAAIVAYYILIVLSWLGLYLTQEMFSSSKWFIVIHSVVLMLVLSLFVLDLFVRFV